MRPVVDGHGLRGPAQDVLVQVGSPFEEPADVLEGDAKVLAQELAPRRVEDGAGARVERSRIDLGYALLDVAFAVAVDQLPDVIVQLLQGRIVMSVLFGFDYALLKIDDLGCRDLDALDGQRRHEAVGPHVAGDQKAEEIALLQGQMLGPRQQAVLFDELRVRSRVVVRRVQRVALLDVTPAMAGFGANVIGQHQPPFGVDLAAKWV